MVVVFLGESLKLRVPIHDGVRTASAQYGALRDLSGAGVSGILTIDKPDGSSDVTRDTSVSGEGTTVDTDGDSTVDAFDFYVADTVTATWTAGYHQWEVEYIDTTPTPDDKKLSAHGLIHAKARPKDDPA